MNSAILLNRLQNKLKIIYLFLLVRFIAIFTLIAYLIAYLIESPHTKTLAGLLVVANLLFYIFANMLVAELQRRIERDIESSNFV